MPIHLVIILLLSSTVPPRSTNTPTITALICYCFVKSSQVFIKSRFIMNGVCVVWKGWLDLQRLDGAGYLEFDEDKAQVSHDD